MKRTFGFKGKLISAAMIAAYAPTLLRAEPTEGCDQKVSATISVDQGHPWRPPFALGRVGSLPVVHVELAAKQVPKDEYFIATYRDGREVERHKLTFAHNPSYYAALDIVPKPKPFAPLFANAPLTSVPAEILLIGQCHGRSEVVARRAVDWPEIEADAAARPDRRIHPVDLGAILPPHDWLLLAGGQTAIVEAAALTHARDLPNARLRAWFDGDRGVEISWPLTRNQRATRELRLPLSAKGERTILHVRLRDGEREIWKKDIRTMIVAQAPHWPAFGAVETKLRYDAPIVTVDPKTGARLPSIDYKDGWEQKFNDVVVFLPNGSRFVFWRGAAYIPFWAGKYNTGVSYQWAEDCSGGLVTHPDGTQDCPEPMFDSELRYNRVRVVESSSSRVHVRWDYQTTDVRYEFRGEQVIEDFYFYPDGFGTRVVTAPSAPGAAYQLTELIIVTPQAAYPFEVLPRRLLEALPLDGGLERIRFPYEQTKPSFEDTSWLRTRVVKAREKPMVYRLFAHKDDHAAAIYFHSSDPSVPDLVFPPFYDQGEMITPLYWGNHWPLNRGKWTVFAMNDQIGDSPGHNSVAGWSPRDPDTGKTRWEVKPLTSSEVLMPDARGHVRTVNITRMAWTIAHTGLADEALREWGRSLSTPPAIEMTGARLDIPSYTPERRALRLVAEQPAIEIKLKPADCTVNPVFEIDQAPKELKSLTIDGKAVPADAYAWDGGVLWIKATIGKEGATIGVRFR